MNCRDALLTGDTRGDKILAGLELVKLVKKGGKLRVNILKVPRELKPILHVDRVLPARQHQLTIKFRIQGKAKSFRIMAQLRALLNTRQDFQRRSDSLLVLTIGLDS